MSRPRLSALALCGLALAVTAPGCGADEEEDAAPTISVPPIETQSVPAQTQTKPKEPGTKKPGGGGGGNTGGTDPYDPSKPDSPENDIPPPPGSPQEQFEQMCDANPAACG
jgi:hypothetical protein